MNLRDKKEHRVISALTNNEMHLYNYAGDVKPEMMVNNKHKAILSAMHELMQRGIKVSWSSIAGQLKKSDELDNVGMDYITSLKPMVSSYSIKDDIKAIKDAYVKRVLYNNANAIIEDLKNDDLVSGFDLHQRLQEQLDLVINNVHVEGEKTIKDVVNKSMEEIARAIENKHKGITPGITTGLNAVDSRFGGYHPTDLIVLAARPGMGKTAYAINCIREACINKQMPMVVFSLEMSAEQLVQRLVSQFTGISTESMRSGVLSTKQHQEVERWHKKISVSPLIIDDTPRMHLTQMQMRAKKYKRKNDIKMIIVDYLQLMRATAGSREQEVSQISAGLKGMAKEMDVPVLALAQLSREVEKRGGAKIPQLSDLRESGSIEQDADMVQFIYRPEAAGFEHDKDGNALPDGLAYIVTRKNRHGQLGQVECRFIKHSTKFEDYEHTTDNGEPF